MCEAVDHVLGSQVEDGWQDLGFKENDLLSRMKSLNMRKDVGSRADFANFVHLKTDGGIGACFVARDENEGIHA